MPPLGEQITPYYMVQLMNISLPSVKHRRIACLKAVSKKALES